MITEDTTVLWDDSSDSEEEIPENTTHLLLSFQSSVKELVLLYRRSQNELVLVRLIEEILSELLFQDIEFSSFSNNLSYFVSFVVLNETETEGSHLLGVVLMGILQRILSHQFKPSPTKFTNLRMILDAVEEVGVVDQKQFSQYHQYLLGMFQREALPYPELHSSNDGVLLNEQNTSEQMKSLRDSVVSMLGCSENITEATALSMYDDHKTVLFTENLIENVKVMSSVIPLIQHLIQQNHSSHYDSQFCDYGMVILLSKLYYEISQYKNHLHDNQESLSILLSTIHSILTTTIDSSSQYSYLAYSYLIGLRECFSLLEDTSDVSDIVDLLKRELLFVLNSITQQGTIPQYISFSSV